MFEDIKAQKELVEDLKVQWKCLWSERLDDHVRAEGIATHDYSTLFVEKGTIIHATRCFRALSFKEILELNKIQNAERFIPPNAAVGGWTKFVKTHITGPSKHHDSKRVLYESDVKVKGQGQQARKGGRGWLHK